MEYMTKYYYCHPRDAYAISKIFYRQYVVDMRL